MTRQQFLDAYRHHVAATYGWAGVPGKLDAFMDAVARTIQGPGNFATLDPKSHCVLAAWAQAGGAGVPSLKKLRELV